MRVYIKNTFFLIFLSILTAHLFLKSTQYLRGDGFEYMLMSESFINHASPDLQLTDVYSLADNMSKTAKPNPLNRLLFPAYVKMINEKSSTNSGYFRANNNEYYSYHFWLYSLINVPALYLTTIFHASPVHSFLLTNSLIFLFTIFYLSFTKLLSQRQRLVIITFYLLGGATYYFDWSSPELFSASLLLIGLFKLLKKEYIFASLLFALAGQQNPPIAMLALLGLFFSFLSVIKKITFNKETLFHFIKLLLVFLVAILSPLFFYLHFKVPSVIVSSGNSVSRLISWDRFFSFFFDINQGMIVALSSVFLVLAISSIGLIFHPAQVKNRHNAILALSMLIITILLAIPCLSTGNWNSGQSIFMRYAYWVSMPLGIALMLLLDCVSKRMFIFIFSIFLIGQLSTVIIFNISGRMDTTKYKSLSYYLINNKPEWYNPIPAVFVERGLGKENPPDDNQVYYYVNSATQSVTKILYHSRNIHKKLPFCENKTIEEMTQHLKPIATENNWFYLNDTSCHTDLSNGLHTI